MTIVGNAYLEHGRRVVVEIQWGAGGGPRNVLVRRADGELVVRPFRGLRRIPDGAGAPVFDRATGEYLGRA